MLRPWAMAVIWLPTVGVATLSTEVWEVIVLMCGADKTRVWFDSKYPQDTLYPHGLISSLGAEQLWNSDLHCVFCH